MRPGEASRTIQRPATLRAAHQLLDDEPRIFVDPLAVGLIPEASIESIRADEPLLRNSEFTLLRSTFVLRARYTEDCLAERARDGVAQYVILGAGLDTFAYRQPAFAKGLRIFEVDHPATQAWKRQRISARGIAAPANLRFVPVDFERERLGECLAAHGFGGAEPAFFSWLGVVMFLTAQALEATLRFVASLPRGSGIALSFNPPDESLEGEHLELARQSVIRCASRGEPWLSRHRPGELCAIAARSGFSSTYHLTPELAADRYFANRRDGLRAPRHEQLFVASV